jgi:hypothetical protein
MWMRTALAMAGALTVAVLTAGCGSTAPDQPRPEVWKAPLSTTQQSAGTTPDSRTPTPPPAPPAHTPCDRNDGQKWVFVSLRRQHMWMCSRHRIAGETAITSGMTGAYTHTPTGRYHIQGLNRDSTLTLNTGATYAVKFWIPFDAPLFGFHDSSWQQFPYGSPKYKTKGSHGCVHLPLKAIRFLYHWVDIGTPVHIRA